MWVLDFNLGDQRGYFHRRSQLSEHTVAGVLCRTGVASPSRSLSLFTAIACIGAHVPGGVQSHQRPRVMPHRRYGDRPYRPRQRRSAGAVCAAPVTPNGTLSSALTLWAMLGLNAPFWWRGEGPARHSARP
jgi:hypothetical protein